MNFERPMLIELTGQEVATIVTALSEIAAKYSHDLLKKFEAIDAELTEQASKTPGPDLKLISQQ